MKTITQMIPYSPLTFFIYRRLLPCFMLLVLSVGGHSQSVQKVLDATAARLTESGDVQAQFKVTQFSGTTPQSESKGTIVISGNRFQIATDEISTWFDGKTQWSMLRNSGEVNVSEPDEKEQAGLNPSVLVKIYKRGFNYNMSKSSLRGRPTFVVHLWPNRKGSEISDILIDVDQKTYDPLCIRAKFGNDWVRFSILSLKAGLHFPDSHFSFPSKDYPGVEVIDLR